MTERACRTPYAIYAVRHRSKDIASWHGIFHRRFWAPSVVTFMSGDGDPSLGRSHEKQAALWTACRLPGSCYIDSASGLRDTRSIQASSTDAATPRLTVEAAHSPPAPSGAPPTTG